MTANVLLFYSSLQFVCEPSIITSAKEVVFPLAFVCLFVCKN